MKNTSLFLLVLSISVTVLFSSFTSADNAIKQINNNPPDEFEILLNYLETNNTFISGESLPIIKAIIRWLYSIFSPVGYSQKPVPWYDLKTGAVLIKTN